MTRHELKEQLQHDQFTDAVSHTIEYARSHRERVIQWSALALVAVLLIGGFLWYRSYRKSVRQADLQAAFNVLDAQVGPPSQFQKTYATADEKTKASLKALSDVIAKDGGTREGYLAQYYRGTLKAQNNDNTGAEADLRAAANSGTDPAALAKIALANLYIGMKRTNDAQALLKSLVDKPTDLVSKGQAQLLLAQLDQTVNPQESKRILQSLKTQSQDAAVSRAADQLSAQITK